VTGGRKNSTIKSPEEADAVNKEDGTIPNIKMTDKVQVVSLVKIFFVFIENCPLNVFVSVARNLHVFAILTIDVRACPCYTMCRGKPFQKSRAVKHTARFFAKGTVGI
jgi:hypothetical protein